MLKVSDNFVLFALKVFRAFEFGIEGALLDSPLAHNALQSLDLVFVETVLLQQDTVLSLHSNNQPVFHLI